MGTELVPPFLWVEECVADAIGGAHRGGAAAHIEDGLLSLLVVYVMCDKDSLLSL